MLVVVVTCKPIDLSEGVCIGLFLAQLDFLYTAGAELHIDFVSGDC